MVEESQGVRGRIAHATRPSAPCLGNCDHLTRLPKGFSIPATGMDNNINVSCVVSHKSSVTNHMQ